MSEANSIPVLGIPFYNRPDLLARCLDSIDYPVDKVVIVDQGPASMTGWLRPRPLLKRVELIRHPNAGVAGAWNELIKLFPARYWMLVNNDIAFALGDLCKLAGRVEYDRYFRPDQRPGVYYGNHAASWFAITDACIRTVGLFDENIYPAYLEDCDYAYRMKLLGVAAETLPEVAAIHGDGVDAADTTQGSRTIHSDPELRRKNGVTHGRNFEYYRAKWGGNNGEERFLRPFNDLACPVWAWRFDPGMRGLQKQQF